MQPHTQTPNHQKSKPTPVKQNNLTQTQPISHKYPNQIKQRNNRQHPTNPNKQHSKPTKHPQNSIKTTKQHDNQQLQSVRQRKPKSQHKSKNVINNATLLHNNITNRPPVCSKQTQVNSRTKLAVHKTNSKQTIAKTA